MSGAPSSGREALEARLGYRFRDPEILDRALTHPSWAEEQTTPTPHNQRLEFLGDAVLGLVVSEELWAGLTLDEGGLSELRAHLVCEDALHGRASALRLAEHLRVGRGAGRRGDAERPSTLADTYEAVLAAVFLDGGLDAARGVVRGWLGPAIEEAAARPRSELRSAMRHPKTQLQERMQAAGRGTPTYRLVGQEGPPHDAEWTVEVVLDDGTVAGVGTGRSKREAATAAARVALAGTAS